MSEIIQDADGNDVTVFISTASGFVDAICRADTKAAWEAAALSQNLLVDDPERGLIPAPGANIDVLGPVVITEAVLDDEGNEVTPAVMDTRYHVNLRIAEPMLSAVNSEGFLKWKVTAINWTTYGQPETGNKSEAGVRLASVTLIDPATINSPARVWA